MTDRIAEIEAKLSDCPNYYAANNGTETIRYLLDEVKRLEEEKKLSILSNMEAAKLWASDKIRILAQEHHGPFANLNFPACEEPDEPAR